jgi:predicted RND superfamily exporter protein
LKKLQDNNNSKIFFGVKMRKFLIFFAFLVNLISSVQARLLSESEMTDFIDNNEENISHLQKQYGIHKGYSVIEVAKQEIIKRTTSKEYREKCKDIIFSALNGIGLGGVD